MSWLRRRKEPQEPSPPPAWPTPEGQQDGPLLGRADAWRDEQAGGSADERPERVAPSTSADPQGPWDVSEAPIADGLVDLGALRLPGRDGMELRLEVEEESGRVIAATIQLGESAVQLQAFAAPRTEGIWDEIRREIAASVTRQGGTADEVPGPFGKELLARVPARAPDGSTAHQPARFAGIDGPRWFLRAVFHGAAVYQEDAAAELETLVRGVVVVRGGEAMAPRELLSLSLPEGAEGTQDGADGGAQATGDAAEGQERVTLRPPQRGPEITEVR